MRKANEGGYPLYVASPDIEQVFDQVETLAVEEAMVANRALAWCIAAVLREQIDQRA